MKLSDLLSTLYSFGVDEDEVIDKLQTAYECVVNMLRLHHSVHPLLFQEATKIGGFENKLTILDSGSEIAFKHIDRFPKAKRLTSFDNNYSIYNGYSFSITNIESNLVGTENCNRTIIPEYFIRGEDLISTNNLRDPHRQALDFYTSNPDLDLYEGCITLDHYVSSSDMIPNLSYSFVTGYVYPYFVTKIN